MTLTNEDRMAILDLLARYNYRSDFGGEGWPDCFTEDGAFIAGPHPQIELRGTDELEAYAREHLANRPAPLRHNTNNSVIEAVEGSPDEATHSCYLMVASVGGDGALPVTAGIYRDRLARIDGEWRFRERRLEFHSNTSRTRLPARQQARAAIGQPGG